VGAPGHLDLRGRVYLYYGPFDNTANITLNWDSTNVPTGKHTLQIEIPPVPGEQNTKNNFKAAAVEVKERLK